MAEPAPSAEDDTNSDRAGYPAGVLAAAVLAITGDADVVIEPGEQNMRRARAALADMALQPHAVPQTARLAMLDIVTIMTSYGKIDCLLRRGRLDWDRLRTNADVILVAGAEVVVAASSDAWKLRRRFKDGRR
jgi:hypothetical protein